MSIIPQNRPRPIVIFSVEKSDRTKEQNSINTSNVEVTMDNLDISYRKCIGSYKGQLETSFVITQKAYHKLKDRIFDMYDQESVLHVNEDDFMSLVFNPKLEKFDEPLGWLTKTSIENAINNKEAFTIAGNFAYVAE